ncbi:MAG: GGDEF domain-containing protein [Acidimicrobiia bacterium]|nr:GGDEF domain-containing protein [Acidimicrobiia bacterium]
MIDEHAAAALRRAHHEEVRTNTRETGLMAGAILLVALPLWSVFDQVHEPEHAGTFLILRLATEVLGLAVWGMLWAPRFGRRRAEPLVLLLLALPVVAIAGMLVQVDRSLEPYLLGFSLPLYGSAFLLVWRWQLTAALVAIAAGALAVALLSAPSPPASRDLVTTTFYLGTASVISLFGQVYRQRLAWREFSARAALQREQERSSRLLRELERLSQEDALTGLANRRRWDELLDRQLRQARRSGEALAVLLCDLDHFKQVNDDGGHAQGDAVLREVASCLLQRVRSTDVVARLGGDEVGVLCPGAGIEEAAALAIELHEAVRACSGPGVTLSVGVAVLAEGDPSPEALLARADEELSTRARRSANSLAVLGAPFTRASSARPRGG